MPKRPTMFHLIYDFEGEMEYGIYSTFEKAKAEVDKVLAETGQSGYRTDWQHKQVSKRKHVWTSHPYILTIEELDVDLPMEG